MQQAPMHAPIQARTLKTRARLLDAASNLIAKVGYGDLRVEEVVRGAGVAKGTFFAHFKDKDALMDLLIGAEIDRILDALEGAPVPISIDEIITVLEPLTDFMAQERYVFDLIIRHSGAAAVENIGPIAMTFDRFIRITAPWIEAGPFRKDAGGQILAEGLQSFMVNAIALNFCALHNSQSLETRLRPYLELWLIAPRA
jgi:AcrR family transcriptional regulator